MICQYCNKETKSKVSKQQHEIRCKSNPNKISLDYLSNRTSGFLSADPTPCKFCFHIYDHKMALHNHERRCRENPDRILEIQTQESKLQSLQTKIQNGTLKHSDETKRKISDAMKKVVSRNPDAYTSSNRGRTRQIIYDGIKFQGQWEVDFYKWVKINDLDPIRPPQGFEYVWNGNRTYFPDFFIKKLNLYVEVKGYETDRDRAKWSQFPEALSIIKAKEINRIRSNTFDIHRLLDVQYRNRLVA